MSGGVWAIPHASSVFTETINFSVGAAFFVRSVFKAIWTYVKENKTPGETGRVKGTGLKELPPDDDLPSIVEIRRALPGHCLRPIVSTSLYYTAKDVAQVVVAYAALSYLDSVVGGWSLVRAVLVLLYWAVQGTFFFALFVLGHDCGHGSFSNNSLLNDVVGTISHGFLLVPYYQWKLSHRNHHKHTGNMDKDEVFYPVRRRERSEARTLLGFGFGFGWFIYLAVGYNPRRVQHFHPLDKMFIGHLVGCLFSLAALLVTLLLCHRYYSSYGLASLCVYYLVPVFIMATYIVVVTFLHHSEVNTPWYADDRWDFVRGQLSTVDRHYGIVHDVIHSIGTHQMHHMFTKIPHYHLEEATVHFRQAFPHLVRSCDEPILPSFVRMFNLYERQSIIENDVTEAVYK